MRTAAGGGRGAANLQLDAVEDERLRERQRGVASRVERVRQGLAAAAEEPHCDSNRRGQRERRLTGRQERQRPKGAWGDEPEGAVSDGAVVCEAAGGVESAVEVVGGEGGEEELEPREANVVGEGADGLHAAVGGAAPDAVALRAHMPVEDVASAGGAPPVMGMEVKALE
jgi:hypothetical protein